MSINIVFSFAFNEAKADEPLGCVLIAEDDKCLHATNVYLDSFFSALVAAFAQSEKGPVTIDVPVEREAIHMERKGLGLTLTFAEGSLTLSDVGAFAQALKSACIKLISSFPEGVENNSEFDPVRAFIEPPSVGT